MNGIYRFIGHTVLTLDSLGSTNDYLKKLSRDKNIPEGVVVSAKEQTAGRGQKGNSWVSERDKNLTFSIYLKPRFLAADKQFYLSMISALSVVEFLNKHNIDAQIKWPNDILVNKRKISGILIENTLKGKTISESITGIGINVFQTNFKIPATSMILENNTLSGKNTDEFLQSFISIFEKYYLKLREGKQQEIYDLYFANLFGKTGMNIKINHSIYRVKIVRINETGSIVLLFNDGSEKEFTFKEFKTVLE